MSSMTAIKLKVARHKRRFTKCQLAISIKILKGSSWLVQFEINEPTIVRERSYFKRKTTGVGTLFFQQIEQLITGTAVCGEGPENISSH